jgi:hypothetical protein
MKKKRIFSGSSGKYRLLQFALTLKLTAIIILASCLPAAAGFSPPQAANATITGTVTNLNGEPIRGASVRVKGSAAGTSTDSSGSFSITVPENAILVFSFVGYAEQELPTAGQTSLNVILVESTKELEQVVVVGYGTQRKIDVTGSVATVKGEEISKQSSINPISGLQGKVAGVQITNAGAPGASPQIRIRGLGTVYGSANPLYVVDGVWFDDISFLNPDDIE